jgi:DNA-binding NarL/FixJ family response regulator
MSMTARVLIVDNDPRVGRDLQALLESQEYGVRLAQGVGQALLEQAVTDACAFRPHVAIVDLRLLDDYVDERSGLELLKSLQSARCILYSAYLSPEVTLEALKRYSATSWVSKSGSPSRLLDEVAGVLQESCAFPRSLVLNWPSAWNSQQIVKALFGEDTDVPPDIVEDVLGQLFPENKRMKLETVGGEVPSALSVSPGRSLVFKAWPDDLEPVVVKLASAKRVQNEAERYREHIQDRLVGLFYAHLERTIEFWDLGGTVYKFMGSSLGPLTSFTTFYRKKRDPEVILKPLRHLFTEVWSRHYSSPQHEDLPLFRVYDQVLNLKERLEKFSNQKKKLSFPGLPTSLINPVPWVLRHTDDTLILGARQAITHGDLRGDNLFMDDERAWAIDYERAGPGHILRDFVELEMDIVTRFLPDEVDLSLLYELVLVLVEPLEPTAPFRQTKKLLANPETRKALNVIAGLRQLAYEMTRYPDSREYLWGLLLDALFVATLVSEKLQRERALLLGAVLCCRLRHWGEEWPPQGCPPVALGPATSAMPPFFENLSKAVSNREAVLFVGSGMSREGGLPSAKQLTETLAKEIRHELEPATNLARMAQYVQNEPGFGRGWLVDFLIEKLSSGNVATSHRLVPRFPWAAVYTTNYDTLLEEGYRAEVGTYRKVLYSSALRNIQAGTTPIVKIHGCIEYGDGPDVRLIVTEDDYTEFEQHRKGLIAGLKRSLYSGASIVFVGYGLADDNLWGIYNDVWKELGDHLQYSYAVMPEASVQERRRLEKKQIVLLPYTAEEFFLTLAEQLGVSTIV